MDDSLESVGIVVIGRNEAAHLAACLAAVPARVAHRVYVDSASSDGSADIARSAGVEVIELDPGRPMSAARARNAGLERVLQTSPDVRFVQFVDGDCVLAPGWLDAGLRAIADGERVGAVWGQLRERRPDASIYNRICDLEWRVPPAGDDVSHFGGIVMIRVEAIRAAGGYDATVVASEDHELSGRVRAAGWRIRRLDVPMATHDARLTQFAEWWRRGVRHGVGHGQLWSRRREGRHLARVGRTIAWGAVVPVVSVACAPITGGWSLLGFALYPLRMAKIAGGFVRRGGTVRDGLLWGAHCVAAPFPTLCGLIAHASRRVRGRESRLVEYRRPTD